MWKRVIAFAHRFGFTQNEAAVIVFLSVVIITGSVLSELRSTGATPRRDIRDAYADADSVFARRAGRHELRETDEDVSTHAPDAAPDAAGNAATPESVAKESARIVLNTATVRQLTTLPGIGPATAEKIIAYRERNGPFRSPADIMKVKGIGQKKYENIRQFITVE
ncbi:MAG: ComEA family DNA-binding protein [Bacteroidota bacterium]|nr:ComEA family DNA-binding protein [Bacteroidota bacterium]